MVLKIKFYANTDMPIYVLYGCFGTTMAGLDSFFRDYSTQTLKHFICGHPLRKFADPQPTQINNSRYGTRRLTEGTQATKQTENHSLSKFLDPEPLE